LFCSILLANHPNLAKLIGCQAKRSNQIAPLIARALLGLASRRRPALLRARGRSGEAEKEHREQKRQWRYGPSVDGFNHS
jgi:hypothetical protein